MLVQSCTCFFSVRSGVLQQVPRWCQQHFGTAKLYWQGCWRRSRKQNTKSQRSKSPCLLPPRHRSLCLSFSLNNFPSVMNVEWEDILFTNNIKNKLITHVGWVRNDELIWCFPKCWFVFVIVIYIRPKKNWKMIRRFTHVINNKMDGDNKPTTPRFNNTTDDLLWVF